MIQDIKPYPAYKDSGVPWLGDVPEHWDLLPNRAIFSEVKDRNHPDEEMLSVTIKGGVIKQKALLENSSKKDSSNKDKSAYKLVCPRDIAYNKMRAWQCAIGASDLRGIISPAYVVMRLRKDDYNHMYFHHLYRTPQFGKEAERWSYGITSDMWSLRPEHFKIINTPIPPPDEQAAIVRFLDHTDRRIRRFIRAKRRMIELLNEQKQAITHHTVTRGLNPDVRLKPSGVQWLGDVPEHWEVILLGRCVSHIEQGWSPVAADGDLDEDQWAVLTLSSVRRGFFNSTAIKPVSKSAKIPSGIEVSDGDFLLTRSNTRDRVGDVCIVEGVRPKTILCDLIYRLQIQNEKLNPRFLMYQLLAPLGRGQIERDARGSSGTMPKIAQGHIKAWKVVLPSIEEQDRIVTYIDAETNKINEIINRSQREIDLIREYRTRLITDVVTGKLDVRGVAVESVEEELEDLLDTDIEEIDEEVGEEDLADE